MFNRSNQPNPKNKHTRVAQQVDQAGEGGAAAEELPPEVQTRVEFLSKLQVRCGVGTWMCM